MFKIKKMHFKSIYKELLDMAVWEVQSGFVDNGKYAWSAKKKSFLINEKNMLVFSRQEILTIDNYLNTWSKTNLRWSKELY